MPLHHVVDGGAGERVVLVHGFTQTLAAMEPLAGRLRLRLALDRPELVRALVLSGASPGLDDPVERAARQASDGALAAELERVGLERFLDRWLAQPLFATLPPERAGRAGRLANTTQGLAASLRLHGTGAQEPLWDRLATLRPPTLLITGARDQKFAGIAERMAKAIGPSATLALVPDAGHAAHLERPDEGDADQRHHDEHRHHGHQEQAP